MIHQSIVDYSSDSDVCMNDDDYDNDIRVDNQQLNQVSSDELIIKKIINRLLFKVEKRYLHQFVNSFRSHREQPFHYDTDDTDDDHLSPWSPDDNESDINVDDESDSETMTACKTEGELTFDELPKIERLNIHSPVEQLTQIGTINSFVNQLVIVQSFTTVHVLDLDSTLFLKDGSPLGQIFDVIGPVRQPNYVVRFNSSKEIRDMNLSINMAVYYNGCFPEPYTKYVFVNHLIRQKGCDASWKDNNEPPPEHQDYSDDEQERQARWKFQAKSRLNPTKYE
uniref:H/ACA ribonucleoprotein complex subunit n=1 Tax=Dermatophagoides pteronyssinus TaxID=6956 RepID=A0A6P6XPN8_DERPT|nr:H/ACA ribonucleoprotein complex non-core subunit NAF1-like [Dermatophagoides pteronyssinus]